MGVSVIDIHLLHHGIVWTVKTSQHHSLPDNIYLVALILLYSFTASEHIVLTLMYTYCLTDWSDNDCSGDEDEWCVTCTGISCGILVRLDGVQSKS